MQICTFNLTRFSTRANTWSRGDRIPFVVGAFIKNEVIGTSPGDPGHVFETLCERIDTGLLCVILVCGIEAKEDAIEGIRLISSSWTRSQEDSET